MRDRTRGPGVDVLLGRALTASAAAAGAAIEVAACHARPWHSATFSGARHCIEAEVAHGVAVDRWITTLTPDAMALPGHLIADVAVHRLAANGARRRIRIDALTVVDTHAGG